MSRGRPEPVLAVDGLAIAFPGGDGGPTASSVRVVHGLSFVVRRGETLAIVGESGCGKSVSALAMMGLLPPEARLVSGAVELLGRRLTGLPEKAMRRLRGDRIGMVFQNPMSALNPVLTVGEQLVEAIRAHRRIDRHTARARAEGLLARVRLPEPAARMADYPHQLSGGMRQRVLIAIAIANDPDVLIADEPTTALDATVQGEILALLHQLQRESGMALVLITHDLGLVARWARSVIVMYAGRKVEERPAAELLRTPAHPYTRALLGARPDRRSPVGGRSRLAEIPGLVPPPGVALAGCAFAERCADAFAPCWTTDPVQRALPSGGTATCHALAEARPVAGEQSP